MELEALEGWLIKKKRPDKTSFFGKDTKRWFKIQKIKGSAMDDLCMCYFKGPNDDAPSGWIYLKDVRELSDDGKIFTVVTTQRKIVLEAQSKAEHKLWLQGLVDYSPFVTSLVGIQSDINYRRKTPMPTPAIGIPIQGREVVSRHDDNDAKPGSFVPRERTFSRHIQDGDMSNAGGPGAASFRQSYNMENERSFYHHMNNNSDTEDSGRERETATTRHRDRDGEGSAPIVQPRKKDLTRGGGVGTMGANAGSSSSRMYAHIAKNNSSGSLNGGNSSNNEGSLSLSTSRPRSRDAKDEEPDIDTDYTSLAADKLEPVRQRLQQLEDDAADAKDSSDEEGMRRRSPPRISTSPAPAPGDTINDPTKRSFTPKGPVSHFQTASGGDAHINLPTRDMKSSVDDIISRSSSQCNSARRAPPISSYSPRTSVDQQNRGGLNDDDDDDDMPFDISVSLLALQN